MVAPAITHGMSYKGKELYGGSQKDFIKCRCGEKIYYTCSDENPWDKLQEHVVAISKAMSQLSEKPKPHTYGGTYFLAGLEYVKCGCGWSKKVKPAKEPRNMWEGHKGFEENKEYKLSKGSTAPGKRKESKVKTAAKNFWYGNGEYWYKKGKWDSIEPIAKEVFGGTFFVVPTKHK